MRYYSSLRSDIEHWTRQHHDAEPIFVLHDSQIPVVTGASVRFDAQRLLPAMNAAREIKDAHEIQLIRRANEISALAHRKVLGGIQQLVNEAEIEASFLSTCIGQGAKNQSYGIIAASGENAAVLHYSKNDEPLDGRQLVCLDAGAEWNCYASDVTRTFPLTGEWPSAEAKAIYGVVEEMQEQCIKAVKQGVRFVELMGLADKLVVRGLKKLGILKGGDETELLAAGISRVFLPHGLGHHVGLEVHDVSATSAQQNSNCSNCGGYGPSHLLPAAGQGLCAASAPALAEGMVITIEPGIYFSRFALDDAKTRPIGKYIDFKVVGRYIPVGGVRIEDDILVTAQGFENLTTAPKGEEMLEVIRKGSGSGQTK